MVPPFKPKLSSETDTSNFDPEFTNAPMTGSLNARASAIASANFPASTPLSPGMQANFKGFTFVDESNIDDHFESRGLEPMDEDSEDNWDDNYRRDSQDDDRHYSGSPDARRMSGIMHDESGLFGGGGMDL